MNDDTITNFSRIDIGKELGRPSKLTLSLGGKPTTRRRSSVLRRMSIGNPLEPSTLQFTLNEVEGTAVLEEESDKDSDDSGANGGADNNNNNNDDDYDDILYRRSDSSTKVTIKDFERLCVLGQGAYGKVILVKSKRNGMLFAQKELKKASVIVTNKSIERTLSERTILSKITKHPNIVKLFYALHDESKLYLLMEFIPGGELFQYLAKEKFLDEKKTSFYIIQMAMALRYLHSCGIIYRDLKPENCMLDKYGYLILTDFGLAKQAMDHQNNSSDWCNSIIGTPEYCAPEVLRGSDYGFKADWWSLGCVMFDLLTGDPPFTGKSHTVIMKKVLKDKPKYPFHVMAESKQLMNKLLEKNADKRIDIDSQWDQFQKLGFFKYYKFKDIELRKIDPPIKPQIGILENAECFDKEFTHMKISALDIPQLKEDNDSINAFKDFSFIAAGSYFEEYH